MNVIQSYVPYSGMPANAVGGNNTTKEIASYCHETQKNAINETFGHLTLDTTPSYKWPIIGTVVSALSLLLVSRLK